MQTNFDQDVDCLEQAMSTFMRTVRRPRFWEEYTHTAGFSVDRPAATILQILGTSPSEKCRLHNLIQRLGIEAPSVSRKLQELESAGLVNRSVDPEDGRAQILRLSDQGRNVTSRLQQAKRAKLADVLRSWPDKDRHQFVQLLKRFTVDMAKQLDDPKENLKESVTKG